MKVFPFISGLAASNFLFRCIQDNPNWHDAWERSFFQAIAVLAFALINKVQK